MKRDLKLTGLLTAISILLFATSTWAGSNCPQPRKTKSAPSNIASLDKTTKASAENGKKIYAQGAKPVSRICWISCFVKSFVPKIFFVDSAISWTAPE